VAANASPTRLPAEISSGPVVDTVVAHSNGPPQSLEDLRDSDDEPAGAGGAIAPGSAVEDVTAFTDARPQSSDDLQDFDSRWRIRRPTYALKTPFQKRSNPPSRSNPARDGRLSPDAADFVATVGVNQEKSHWIDVPKNTSIVINVNTNIDRAEVADPEIIEVFPSSPTRLVVTGKNFGSTQLVIWSESKGRVFNVTVEMDLSRLRSLIQSASPTAEVKVQSVKGTIVLSGRVRDVATGERLVELAELYQGGEIKSQLQVAGLQQVMLEVTFAEVRKEATRQLGINWGFGASRLSRDFFFANNIGQLNPTIMGSSGVPNVLTGGPTYSIMPTANGMATNFTFGLPRVELQMFLNALRENGLSRTLAEPNLVAVSGETASFLAGGEVPIPVAQSGTTVGAITIQYKEFGIRLDFMPTVIGANAVRLKVMAEVSNLQPSTQIAGGLPTFTFMTRRIESTVECGDNESFAIAGLLDEHVRGIASKIPGLGDIPVLGALFSSVQYQKSTTELIVLVTPHLVEPVDAADAPTPPGSSMTDPSDYELFGLQQLQGSGGSEPEGGRADTRSGIDTARSPNALELRGPWGMANPGEN
jgi:pilus assembly protein CpaC